MVIGQAYLPRRPGLGGLLAAGLGFLADATSITTALLTLPAFTLVAAALAMSLPREGSAEGREPGPGNPAPARLTVEA